MSRSGLETLPNVREWSVGPPVRPGVVEALSDVRELLGGPLECLGVVGSPSQMSGSGRQILSNVQNALLDIQEWSIGPPRYPGVVD